MLLSALLALACGVFRFNDWPYGVVAAATLIVFSGMIVSGLAAITIASQVLHVSVILLLQPKRAIRSWTAISKLTNVPSFALLCNLSSAADLSWSQTQMPSHAEVHRGLQGSMDKHQHVGPRDPSGKKKSGHYRPLLSFVRNIESAIEQSQSCS